MFLGTAGAVLTVCFCFYTPEFLKIRDGGSENGMPHRPSLEWTMSVRECARNLQDNRRTSSAGRRSKTLSLVAGSISAFRALQTAASGQHLDCHANADAQQPGWPSDAAFRKRFPPRPNSRRLVENQPHRTRRHPPSMVRRRRSRPATQRLDRRRHHRLRRAPWQPNPRTLHLDLDHRRFWRCSL